MALLALLDMQFCMLRRKNDILGTLLKYAIVADEYLEPQNFSKKIRILYLEPQKVLRTSEVLSTILRTSDILIKHVFSINLFFLTCKYEICCMDMQKPEEFSMKSTDLRLIIQSKKININV